ncbi:hypothetical protein [Streptomyces sp. NPDC001933]|uniref:hypothetical protein n=1 Tax=Streptomyces sp. NPDC001933 TaxID=3364626 RepID=UPI0036AF42DD
MYVLRRACQNDLDACRKLWADRSGWAARRDLCLPICQLTDAECAAAEVLVLSAEDCVVAAVAVIDQTPGAGWSSTQTQQEAIGLALMVTSPFQRTTSLSRLLVRWAADRAARTEREHVRAAVSCEGLAGHFQTRHGWERTGTHTRNSSRTALLQRPAAYDNQIRAILDDQTAQIPDLNDTLTARELIGAATPPHRPPTPGSKNRPSRASGAEGLYVREAPQPTDPPLPPTDQHTAAEMTPPTVKNLGLPRIPRSKRLTGAEAEKFADQVVHAYLVRRAPTPLISHATGRSGSAIRNVLRRRDVTLRSNGFPRPVVTPKPEAQPRKPHESAIQAVSYTACGKSVAWTSDHLGVSADAVRVRLRQAWRWLGGTGPVSRTRLIRLAVQASLIDAPPDPGVRPTDIGANHLAILHGSARGMDESHIADATQFTRSQVTRMLAALRKQFGAKNAPHLIYLASSLIDSTAADYAEPGIRS